MQSGKLLKSLISLFSKVVWLLAVVRRKQACSHSICITCIIRFWYDLHMPTLYKQYCFEAVLTINSDLHYHSPMMYCFLARVVADGSGPLLWGLNHLFLFIEWDIGPCKRSNTANGSFIFSDYYMFLCRGRVNAFSSLAMAWQVIFVISNKNTPSP